MAGGYSITISAVDAASGAINAINQRIQALNKRVALAAAPFRTLGQSLRTFTQVTGLGKIATGFANVALAGVGAARSLWRVIEPLAAITGATSLAGLYKLTSAWAEFGLMLSNQAARAGTTAEGLFSLQNAAKLAGVSADTLTNGMTTLNDNLRNAAFGGAPQFLQVLRTLGLSYEALQQMSPEQRLRAIAEALSKVRSVTDRALYTKEIFGGEGMIPFLNLGAAAIDRLSKRGRELTGTFTPAMTKRAIDFARAQQELGLSVTGLGNSIGNVLGPAITPLLSYLTDSVMWMRRWIDANQDWLRGEISHKVGEFVTWLRGIDWHQVGTDIQGIGTAAKDLVKWFESLSPTAQHSIEVVGALFVTGLLGPVLNVTGAVLGLIAAIGTSLPAAFKLAQIAAEVFNTTTMKLPVFRVIAASIGILDILNAEHQVDDLPADSPLRRDLEQGRDERDANSGVSGFFRQLGIGGASTGAVPIRHLERGEQTRNAQAMGDVFRREGGYTREAAAAMIGSGIQESGLNPQSGKGTAHEGVFQWDERRRALAYAHFHKQVTDMTPEESARAAMWEIDTRPEFAGLRHDVRTSHDVARLNDRVTREFEAPGNYDTEVPRRLGLSQGVLPTLPEELPDQAPSPVRPTPTDHAEPQRTSNRLAPLPSASGVSGAPGATGRVDMNVRVLGAAAAVTARTFGDAIALNIRQPGLVDDERQAQTAGMGLSY